MSGARVASPGVDYNDEDERLEAVQKSSRRHILVFYWIVAILAVPFWWGMTSIQRLSIPEARVQEQSGRRVSTPGKLRLALCTNYWTLASIACGRGLPSRQS